MKTHLNYKDAGSVLFTLGINYYNHGENKNGRLTRYGFFVCCEKLTVDQKSALLNTYSNVQIVDSSKQYAPEIRRDTILFWTKAELKRLQESKN